MECTVISTFTTIDRQVHGFLSPRGIEVASPDDDILAAR